MRSLEAKLAELAKSIEGQVVPDQRRVEVCIKGIVSGFPVTLEALKVGYPFGVNYFLETSSFAVRQPGQQTFKLTILPKYMQGWLSLISRIFLFEGRGQRLNLPQLDHVLRFKYDNGMLAKKFAHYDNVAEKILALERLSQFNEMLIKSDAGIYLSQPTSFQSLDLELCNRIFVIMAELGQVIFEAF